MKTPDQIIDEALGIVDPVRTAISENKITVPRPPQNLDDMDADYKYQRENFYNLVERGQDAIDGILELSKETEHPRAYEVAGQLIKTVGETAEKLIDLQSKLKKLEGEEQKVGTQHNHLYVGSTSELQKFLKKKNVKE